MTAVERACKTISSLVRRAPMGGVLGLQERRLDQRAGRGAEEARRDHEHGAQERAALHWENGRALASEEEDAPVGMDNDNSAQYKDVWKKEVVVEESGRYIAV